MKKYLLSTLLCAALFAFTGCTDDDPVYIGIPDPDTRLVSKVTTKTYYSDGSEKEYSTTLSYDSYNRVVGVVDTDSPGYTVAVSYGSNQVALVGTQTDTRDDESRAGLHRPGILPDVKAASPIGTRAIVSKSVHTDVYNLNADGFIVSGTGILQWFENDILNMNPTEYYNYTYSASYSSGRISRYAQVRKWFFDYEGEESELSSERNFTWSSNNISKINSTVKESGSSIDNSEITYGYSAYDTPKMNLDLNKFIVEFFSVGILDQLGFFGKATEKFINSSKWSRGSYITNYDWTLDENGYPTKVIVTGSDNPAWRSEITVQYKN